MEPKKPKTIDQQWEEVSQKAGITPREHYQLAVQVFFNDSNRKKDVLERANMDFQMHQMEFQNKQMAYWQNQQQIEEMQKQLLGFKLNRQMIRLARRQKINAWLAKPYLWFVSLIRKPKPVPPAVVPGQPAMNVVKHNTQSNDTQKPNPQV